MFPAERIVKCVFLTYVQSFFSLLLETLVYSQSGEGTKEMAK